MDGEFRNYENNKNVIIRIEGNPLTFIHKWWFISGGFPKNVIFLLIVIIIGMIYPMVIMVK